MGSKVALAIGIQKGHGAVEEAGNRQIREPVLIQIPHGDVLGCIPNRQHDRQLKAARAIAGEHEKAVTEVVAHGEVDEAVAVKISGDDRHRALSGSMSPCPGEGAPSVP
jgi:hypothetical protein